MVTPILIDILIVAALVFFAWRGERKGFILTLCSLVAVLVAFIGATLITNAAAPKVAEYIQPKLEQSIQESLEEKLLEVADGGSLDMADVLDALREKGKIYEWAADSLEDALNAVSIQDILQDPFSPDGLVSSYAQKASKAAAAMAGQLARSILFPIVFLLLLIAWAFVSHALDLVSKLPVINSLNHGLGGAMGLIKGVVVVYVVVWVLCGPVGAITPQMAQETHLLRLMTQYDPIGLLGK